jgi:FdrA protein
MVIRNAVVKNRFYDSVFLMQIATKIKDLFPLRHISVLMGTESNKSLLKETALLTAEGEMAQPGDLVIAVEADSDELIEKAAKKVQELLEVREVRKGTQGDRHHRTIAGAAGSMEKANVVLISLPGSFVAYEAGKALEQGLNVMIFSDNVPLAEEVILKERARELGLIVMGPDCGTSIIKGKALGFANVVKSGPVGIVGASGTGIQQVSVLLSSYGVGITHAIGIGSRDLSKDVHGITMLSGMAALEKDPSIEVIVLISKPPDREVAAHIIDEAEKLSKPVIVNFINADPALFKGKKVDYALTLEEAVWKTLAKVTLEPYRPLVFDEDLSLVMEKAGKCWKSLKASQAHVRGLYSGGTLCEEAVVILKELLGTVYSNTKVFPDMIMNDARKSAGTSMIDLGDDEFTRGTPHPMIDYTLRKERMLEESHDPGVAVILLDVVLGYGSHRDPASELLPVITEIQKRRKDEPIIFVASLCGTPEDPQGLERQKRALEGAGVMILPSNAQAARFAALVATRGKVADRLKVSAPA